jgi:hypothetical protein
METVSEWCSNCQNEVELERKFQRQICPICKIEIFPCAQCTEDGCSECPLMICSSGSDQ